MGRASTTGTARGMPTRPSRRRLKRAPSASEYVFSKEYLAKCKFKSRTKCQNSIPAPIRDAPPAIVKESSFDFRGAPHNNRVKRKEQHSGEC